MNIAKYTPE